MPHKELFISGHRSNIKADLKIPDNPYNVGIIMSHGGIVNRNSLSRSTLSLAEYFSRRLNAYVLTPDLLGETIYDRDTIEYSDGVNLLSTCIDYLADEMGVDRILDSATAWDVQFWLMLHILIRKCWLSLRMVVHYLLNDTGNY